MDIPFFRTSEPFLAIELSKWLRKLYPCKKEFTLHVIRRKCRRTLGSYNHTKQKISLYTLGRSMNVIFDTAIHEYAHHLQFSEFYKDKKNVRPHGPEFYGIYRALVHRAWSLGIDVTPAYGNSRFSEKRRKEIRLELGQEVLVQTAGKTVELPQIATPKVIITGDEEFYDYDLMANALDKYFKNIPMATIISGMADGADTLAVHYADTNKMTKILFPSKWERHSQLTGHLRNEEMFTIATHLVAFWNEKSQDTKHMIETAKAMGVPVKVILYNVTTAQ